MESSYEIGTLWTSANGSLFRITARSNETVWVSPLSNPEVFQMITIAELEAEHGR